MVNDRTAERVCQSTGVVSKLKTTKKVQTDLCGLAFNLLGQAVEAQFDSTFQNGIGRYNRRQKNS